MTPLPTSMLWIRTDVPGSEMVVLDDSRGLDARGSQHAIDPIPYRLDYEVRTDERWATTLLRARCEGAGWWRSLELRREVDGWRSEGDGDGAPDLRAFDGAELRPLARPGIVDPMELARAFDVDLGGSPLTNILPLRRLGASTLGVADGVEVTTAWVLPPTLEVIAATHTYRLLPDGSLLYGDGITDVTVTLDEDGWVTEYPGLASRAEAGTPS